MANRNTTTKKVCTSETYTAAVARRRGHCESERARDGVEEMLIIKINKNGRKSAKT